jgi:hypothetical protein
MPLFALLALALAPPPPSDWVPARWPTNDVKSLELIRETPVNCLVLEASNWSREFSDAAAKAGVATLGVIRPGAEANALSQKAGQLGLTGIVLEGDFDQATLPKDPPPSLAIVPLGLRSKMRFTAAPPSIVGTDQGLWPGIHPEDKGATHAAASGAVWIDTNAGFLRYAHAATNAPVWIGNVPPPDSIYPVERYLSTIGDAAMNGARWVVALDADLTKRLIARDAKAVRDWKRIMRELAFYESHREWRGYQAFGQLALVESPESGALLSGGVLDMIATKHTPVRPIPNEKVMPEAFEGAQMAVDVDPSSLTAVQKDTLKGFTRGGGTLLTGPPGWKFPSLRLDQITLSKEDTEKLDQIWKELNSMTGRRNMGARLFNVSTLLSNLVASKDGKQVLLHLVNYADYPVESVTVHLLGKYSKATLYMPDSGTPVPLELYPTDEGVGFDIDKMSFVAAVVLEP